MRTYTVLLTQPSTLYASVEVVAESEQDAEAQAFALVESGKVRLEPSDTVVEVDQISTEIAEKSLFLNRYRCPNDDTEWEDRWSCQCNDKCPTCGAEIEP